MHIHIHFYSTSRELAGGNALALELPGEATLADALARLFAEVPALAAIRSSCLYAVGTAYAEPTKVLSDGDTISIIPPVQGG